MEPEQQPSQAFDYYYSFLVSGCIGLIEAWLNKDAPEPPKQIAALAGDMIKRALSLPFFEKEPASLRQNTVFP